MSSASSLLLAKKTPSAFSFLEDACHHPSQEEEAVVVPLPKRVRVVRDSHASSARWPASPFRTPHLFFFATRGRVTAHQKRLALPLSTTVTTHTTTIIVTGARWWPFRMGERVVAATSTLPDRRGSVAFPTTTTDAAVCVHTSFSPLRSVASSDCFFFFFLLLSSAVFPFRECRGAVSALPFRQ